MEGRRLVAERGLVGRAATALATRAFTELPFESLGPVKAMLKRYFSEAAWDASDENALAAAVGPGKGWWREELDDELAVEFGWVAGRFHLRVVGGGAGDQPEADDKPDAPGSEAVAATFDLGVVPEVTPNPRTLAFRTGPVLEGESRSYRTPDEADDPRAARLLRSFPGISSVLVAHDFVAVTLRRADRWESLLVPVLRVVAEEFAGGEPGAVTSAPAPRRTSEAQAAGLAAVTGTGAPRSGARRETRLARVWRELGSLRPADPGDLDRVLGAARDPDVTRRQVAARLLVEAPPEAARAEWARLVVDGSRSVRRAAVDALVDAGREDLRPLLETGLLDDDAWVRWKALRGLVELGAAGSRPVIAALVDDPDFRVRLEARFALRD